MQWRHSDATLKVPEIDVQARVRLVCSFEKQQEIPELPSAAVYTTLLDD